MDTRSVDGYKHLAVVPHVCEPDTNEAGVSFRGRFLPGRPDIQLRKNRHLRSMLLEVRQIVVIGNALLMDQEQFPTEKSGW